MVRNATRSSGSGRTGTGSRASTEASDSENTLTRRIVSTSAMEPMTKTFAAWIHQRSSTSGWWEGCSSQTTNSTSNATFAPMMARVPAQRRP